MRAKTIIRNGLPLQVAENLVNGKKPKEWQHSKVVMIPKPGKDYSKMKGW